MIDGGGRFRCVSFKYAAVIQKNKVRVVEMEEDLLLALANLEWARKWLIIPECECIVCFENSLC